MFRKKNTLVTEPIALQGHFEREFQEEGRALLGLRVRYTCYFTISLFLIFYLMDRVVFPLQSKLLLEMRVGLALFHTGVFFLTLTSFGRRFPVFLGIVTYVSIGWVIIGMCLLTGGHQSSYYAGLLLVIIGFGVMMPWTLRDALVTAILICGVYFGVILATDEMTNLPIFVNNNFFLWGTALISVICSRIWYGYRRREFLDRKNLERVNQALKDAEAELVQSEKLSTIGLMSAGIAHEINNPIYAISMNLAGLENCLEEVQQVPAVAGMVETCRHHLNRCAEEMSRIKKIIKSLLSYSQKNREGIVSGDLIQGLESTMTLLQSQITGSGITIDWQKTAPVMMEADHAALNQVTTNMILNAIQAGAKHLRISIHEEGAQCRIGFEDDGSGIAPEVLPKIFDPFFTTKDVGKGTGLGLHIAQRIVRAHGGEIHVQSELAKGTRFEIILPRAPK